MKIRKYQAKDSDQIWEILKFINSKGDSFTYHPDSPREEVMADWLSPEKETFVAVEEEKILGTFFTKPNQVGLGSHIANAGYAVSPKARKKGIGRLMGEFSIEYAKKVGFLAMQFNIVVKTNKGAVKLWKSLGFEIIGEIPDAFHHRDLGLTNAFIMYRKL